MIRLGVWLWGGITVAVVAGIVGFSGLAWSHFFKVNNPGRD